MRRLIQRCPKGKPEHDAAQGELTSTENKVAFARQVYNDGVIGYNNQREVFPGSIVTNMFAFLPAEKFKIESETKRKLPRVPFG